MTARQRMPREQRRAWALAYLTAYATISPGEYIGAMGVDRKTALTDLGALVDGGHLHVYGATRDRRYALHTAN